MQDPIQRDALSRQRVDYHGPPALTCDAPRCPRQSAGQVISCSIQPPCAQESNSLSHTSRQVASHRLIHSRSRRTIDAIPMYFPKLKNRFRLGQSMMQQFVGRNVESRHVNRRPKIGSSAKALKLVLTITPIGAHRQTSNRHGDMCAVRMGRGVRRHLDILVGVPIRRPTFRPHRGKCQRLAETRDRHEPQRKIMFRVREGSPATARGVPQVTKMPEGDCAVCVMSMSVPFARFSRTTGWPS
jgi:hypothetical protein